MWDKYYENIKRIGRIERVYFKATGSVNKIHLCKKYDKKNDS
jgi:hypothetical protein